MKIGYWTDFGIAKLWLTVQAANGKELTWTINPTKSHFPSICLRSSDTVNVPLADPTSSIYCWQKSLFSERLDLAIFIVGRS